MYAHMGKADAVLPCRITAVHVGSRFKAVNLLLALKISVLEADLWRTPVATIDSLARRQRLP